MHAIMAWVYSNGLPQILGTSQFTTIHFIRNYKKGQKLEYISLASLSIQVQRNTLAYLANL
jgi:hypothetical protein